MASRDQLLASLERAGQSPHEVPLGDHGRAMLLPYGGRVLGLFTAGDDRNLLWTHPAIGDADTARAFYAQAGWPNSGGDRTWLAPEAELFIADLDRPWETYQVPRALDPAAYTLDEHDGAVTMTTPITVEQRHAGISVEVELARTVTPAANPLRHAPEWNVGVRYVGYTLRVALRFVRPASSRPIRLGIWNLVRMPHGGELRVATYGERAPVVQLGSVDASHLTTRRGLVRYTMSADGIQKIGLYPDAVTGRAGYVYTTESGDAALIVRNFAVDPSATYADAPWDDLRAPGYGFQACNVADPALGRFSELEHHAPGVDTVTPVGCVDTSQLWAFRGSAGDIATIRDRLLGDAPDPDARGPHA